MLNFILGIIVGGVVVGIVIGLIIKSRKSPLDMKSSNGVGTDDVVAVKAENLAKLREIIAASNDKITNDMVQNALGVSDATATRYLDDLEKEGVVEQIGSEGKFVYYLPRK